MKTLFFLVFVLSSVTYAKENSSKNRKPASLSTAVCQVSIGSNNVVIEAKDIPILRPDFVYPQCRYTSSDGKIELTTAMWSNGSIMLNFYESGKQIHNLEFNVAPGVNSHITGSFNMDLKDATRISHYKCLILINSKDNFPTTTGTDDCPGGQKARP